MKYKAIRLTEKKDHIINRSTILTPEQKKEIINFFNAHPNMEGMIDWNRINTLTYRDFVPVMQTKTKAGALKKVKNLGIEGLTVGEDYYKVYQKDDVIGVVPLSWDASKKIASTYIGGTEGRWCTAYQKDSQYWNTYVGSEKSRLIYFVDYDPNSQWGKYAILVGKDGNIKSCWDRVDDQYSTKKMSEDTGIPIPSINLTVKKTMEIEHDVFKAEEKSWLEVSDDVWANVEDGDTSVTLSYALSATEFIDDGNNIDYADSYPSSDALNITITPIGRGFNTAKEIFEAFYQEGINLDTSTGLHLHYSDDIDCSDFERQAYQQIREQSDIGEVNSSDSSWTDSSGSEVTQALTSVLGYPRSSGGWNRQPKENPEKTYSYIIVSNGPDGIYHDLNFLGLDDYLPKSFFESMRGGYGEAAAKAVTEDIGDFQFIYNPETWDPHAEVNPMDRVSRDDGGVWYGDPSQKELEFGL